MNYIVLDFETHDPWIDQGRGSGWPEQQAKFLCAASHHEGHAWPTRDFYCDDITELLAYLGTAEFLGSPYAIVCHNAQYEAGILHSYGFDIESVTWIDTMILAKLFYNNLLDFSLDGLAKRYLGEEKQDWPLGQVAIDLGLVKSFRAIGEAEPLAMALQNPPCSMYRKDGEHVVPVSDPIKIAKKNMEKIFERSPQTVKDYVISDVKQTHKLFKYFMYDEDGNQRFTQEQIDFHSDLIKALVLARSRGVRVHIPTAKQIKGRLLAEKLAVMLSITINYPGLNIQSSKQLAEYFDSVGVEYPRTEKGNPSITKEFMETVEHPLGQLVTLGKKYEKYVRDFIDPILEIAPPNEDYMRVYPEIKIYGAAATGRASCANPNLQQIPKRDPDGALVRKIYHPEEGEDWYSLDFSSQEPRLQVHYAAKIGAQGAEILVDKFKENNKHDLHQQVADLANITRSAAKTINLGLSYGMGDAKLATSLKLNDHQAKSLKRKFNQSVPFLCSLNQYCKQVIKGRGHINTLGGRKLYNETGFERKALNKLIQGGAADQTWTALVELYRAGIKFMFPVHDSIELSLKTKEEALKVKHIMETCMPLLVPSYTDIESGPSWGELQKVSETIA